MFCRTDKMNFELPIIYPLTDCGPNSRSHSQQVANFLELGCSFIQIREKNAGSAVFLEQAEQAVEAAGHFGAKIIINDRVDIAKISGAAGVHLGQDDLSPVEARGILGNSAIIGLSTHTLEQAKAAAGSPVDYIAFGSVFPTVTKKDAETVTGLDLLAEVRLATGNIPLVAIGGITAENAKSVIDAGADSIALISYFSRNMPDVSTAFRKIQDAIK